MLLKDAPTHSPEGYEYSYPVNGDGTVGVPRLKYQAQTFQDVAEIETYKARLFKRELNPEINYDTPGLGFPVFDDVKTLKTLVAFNKAIDEGREDLAWYQITQAEKYALQNRGILHAAINRMVNQFNSGATPDGWLESFQKSFRSA